MPRPGEFELNDPLASANMNALPGGVLGYAQITATVDGLVGPSDIPGLSVTFDVPANRRIRTTIFCSAFSSTQADRRAWMILADGSGTVFGRFMLMMIDNANTNMGGIVTRIETPSSGEHTRKAQFARETGTGSFGWRATSGWPSYILVEDIGPA